MHECTVHLVYLQVILKVEAITTAALEIPHRLGRLVKRELLK